LPVSKPLGAGCSHHAPCLRFRKDASSHGFRGEQYSHAIALFQRKFAISAPPNIDVLVEQRFLRKKARIRSPDDFVPISIAPQTGGSAAQAGTQAGRAATPASSPSDRRRDSSRHRRGDRRRHQQERRSVDSLVQRAHA